MSSLTMHKPLAIRMQNVSKIYKLHGSQSDQLIDVLGLQRFGFRTKTPAKEFAALSDISLDVPRGHRIGIVGRNGAGKTTLLKLICGNFAPTRGEVEVNGTVQALMNIGLGFHPEYTGRENVEASLQYNGLGRDEYQQALDGIVEFCELSDFLDQPFKTYSLGMQARLMFAAATAIRPDILIVDEVLGAGDAYFIAKSKTRVEKLVSSGCTMLLVSHSMQQVLELCDEAIWLDQGRIRMQGEAFLVVKAYEEHMHGPIGQLIPLNPVVKLPVSSYDLTEILDDASIKKEYPPEDKRSLMLQEPLFRPHEEEICLPSIAAPIDFNFLASGGLSRWDSVQGLKFCGFTIVGERGESNILPSMRPAKFVFTLVGEIEGEFNCRYAINIYDHLGRSVTSVKSPADKFSISPNKLHIAEICFNPLQLGPGEYNVSISVHQYAELEVFNATPRFDLLSRSFSFKVELPDSLSVLQTQFFHSAEWRFDLNG